MPGIPTTEAANVSGSVYSLPHDEGERQRLALQSRLLLRAFDNKALHAPIELQDGDWVLDAGTGSGAWIQDIVEQIPTKPQYIGIDIQPALFPEASTRPPNMRFEVHSVIALPKEWTGKFTLVHQRLLLAALRRHEWELSLREMYRVLKPGGWVQLLELQGWASGPSFAKYRDLINTFSEDVGLMIHDITLRLPDFLKESGFVNIHEVTRSRPLGASGGQEGGDNWKSDVMGVFHGHKKAILEKGGYGVIKNDAECEELLGVISKEIDNTPGSIVSFTMFWAQKPFE